MWSTKVIILLLFCYACLSTGNGKVFFVSRNFYNILHWDPGKPAFPEEKVLYSVQYRSDAVDEPYQIKEECQNITALSCNLTAETPSVHDVHYQARVLVNGSLHGRTTTFKPLAQTVLGPPVLSTYTTVSSLHVDVTLPLGPNGVSVADIITSSKNGPSKIGTIYTLKITHPKWAAQANETTTGRFVLNLKNNRTEYCGYVVYKPFSEWGRSESENASFCVTLPGDPLMLLPWFLVIAALLTAIVITSVVCMCNYVKGGKEHSMPQHLQPRSSSLPRLLQSPDETLIFSKLEVGVENAPTAYATIRVKPKVPSAEVGGYSPQDTPCQPWQGSIGSSVGPPSPTSNPEDTSAQSSEIYSVVAVHVPAEEDKDDQQAAITYRETSSLPSSSRAESWNKGGTSPKLTSHGVPPPLNLDACESDLDRQLLLHTVRDPNGQLLLPSLHMLPSLTFQLQSSTGDTASPLNSERKPLLSDVIESKGEGPSLASLQSFDCSEWSDSGCDESSVNTPTQPYCNTHYFPSQPVVPDFHERCQDTPSSDAIFDSGYKQNWVPEILSAASKDSCEYRRTNCPWTWTAPKKEEEEEEEEEEKLGQIHLGNWVVQIQE
ncbi:interferon lambda receptor 1 [Pempheris klunzingeri]|uniref:interferon lambda receptor 1 n=1 Tax=Pempheris klunzingeri TaxID=3127111 RepID=UPI0039809263